jgi:hypothetical protein
MGINTFIPDFELLADDVITDGDPRWQYHTELWNGQCLVLDCHQPPFG